MIKIQPIGTQRSPRDAAFCRASALISLDRPNRHYEIWFDFPDQYSKFIDESGSPWLALLLPFAFLEGHDIDISAPVDPQLLINAKGILRIWSSWYSKSSEIRITSPDRPSARDQAPTDKAVFFSGGVDSFFSALRALELQRSDAKAHEIHLVTVWGLDIPLSSVDGFSVARDILNGAAKNYRVRALEVVTNIRDFPLYEFGSHWYADLSHGSTLAGIGLFLSKIMKSVVIGSSYQYGHLIPWGSHPLVDPLFSTSNVMIQHDGAEATRVEKTRDVLNDYYAARNIRVCWGSAGNCSRCSKCVRTMVTIDLFDSKDAALSFDWSNYSLQNLSRHFLEKEQDEFRFLETQTEAERLGRHDISSAIRECIKSSRVKRRFRIPEKIATLSRLFAATPLLWKCSPALRRYHQKLMGR